MSQADPSRQAEAESTAGLQAATVIVGDVAAIRMEMASVRRRLCELRIEQADLEAALATLERHCRAQHAFPAGRSDAVPGCHR
jgi:hypothetical protein